MKLITSNVRGMNMLYKHKELKAFIQSSRVSIIAIVEHKVLEKNAEKIIKKIVPSWSWHANYNTNNRGRIWVL